MWIVATIALGSLMGAVGIGRCAEETEPRVPNTGVLHGGNVDVGGRRPSGNSGAGRSNADNTRDLIGQAAQEYRQGRLRQALALIQKARDVDPQLAVALQMEAQIRLDLGDRDGYAKTLQAVSASRPRSARVQNSVGRLLVHLGRVDEGLKSLENAVRLAPTRSQYARDLAAGHLAASQPAAAAQALEAALKHDPDDPALTVALARLYEADGQWESAARSFHLALLAEPDGPSWHRQLARCFYHLQDYARSADAYARHVASAQPEMSLGEWILYGDACLRDGRVETAREVFDQISQRTGQQCKDVEVLRSLCWLQAQQPEQAQSIVQAALSRWPGDEALTQIDHLCANRPAE